MTEVIVQAPSSSGILESELNVPPSAWRRLALIGAILQTAPVRWWFARHSSTRAKSDLSKVPIYPGA
jgi:hypothetical protein